MNQWESDKEYFLNSLPSNMGDKIDLLGSMIVNMGNILTVLGIAIEAQEVAQVEEEVEEEEAVPQNTDVSGKDSESDSNIGFVLALLGASLVTIGDLVSTSGIALDIEMSAFLDKKAEEEAKEQNKKMKKMEKQIISLQKNMDSLITVSESLKREVIFLQNIIYPHYYQ